MVLARLLGPERRGSFAVCWSYVNVLVILSLWGCDSSLTYHLASRRLAPTKVLGGAAWVHFRRGPIHPIPRLLGKATTLINCASIALVLAELAVAPHFLWLMGISNFLAGLDYLFFGLSDHPVSTPGERTPTDFDAAP